MKPLKVLLVVTSVRSAFPFIQDISREFAARGIDTDVLDVHDLRLIGADGTRLLAPEWVRRLTGVRKLGTLAVVLFVRRFLMRSRMAYDAVTIHSCENIYVYLVDAFRKVAPHLSVMIWGSDFYQISDAMRHRHRRIFDACDQIAFGNPANARDFTDFYDAYRDKAVLAGFGNAKLQAIRDWSDSASREEGLRLLGLPRGKTVVACGYNGRELQQHRLAVGALAALDARARAQLHVVFQWGYGASASYRRQVEEAARLAGLSFQFLDERLSDREVVALRCVTDMTLTVQASDGLSHSIQESIFAGSVVVAGDWLPYEYLQEQGVHLVRAGREGYAQAVAQALASLDEHRRLARSNAAAIWKLSSWDSQFALWHRLYRGDPERIFAAGAR